MMKNKIIGVMLYPFLYKRWAFILTIPICIWVGIVSETADIGGVIVFGFMLWFMWSSVHTIIFDWFDLFKPLLEWLIDRFNTNYKLIDRWSNTEVYFRIPYWHPRILIENKEYKLRIKGFGPHEDDTYAKLLRKVLFIYLFQK